MKSSVSSRLFTAQRRYKRNFDKNARGELTSKTELRIRRSSPAGCSFPQMLPTIQLITDTVICYNERTLQNAQHSTLIRSIKKCSTEHHLHSPTYTVTYKSSSVTQVIWDAANYTTTLQKLTVTRGPLRTPRKWQRIMPLYRRSTVQVT